MRVREGVRWGTEKEGGLWFSCHVPRVDGKYVRLVECRLPQRTKIYMPDSKSNLGRFECTFDRSDDAHASNALVRGYLNFLKKAPLFLRRIPLGKAKVHMRGKL